MSLDTDAIKAVCKAAVVLKLAAFQSPLAGVQAGSDTVEGGID